MPVITIGDCEQNRIVINENIVVLLVYSEGGASFLMQQRHKLSTVL